MRARDLSFDRDTLTVRPWVDPIVDDIGHDPRSTYVERYWLAILGPSTTFFLRYVVERLEAAPGGFELDLADCAMSLGLGRLQAAGAAFPRTVARSCQFGATRLPGGPVIDVRRRLPPLSTRQLRRLPRARQDDHARWLDEAAASVPEHDLRDQARRLALSIVDLGEGREATERQLRRWRFHPTLAGEAADWAVAIDARRRAAQHPAAPPSGGAGSALLPGPGGHPSMWPADEPPVTPGLARPDGEDDTIERPEPIGPAPPADEADAIEATG
jgi:hypothetical protein